LQPVHWFGSSSAAGLPSPFCYLVLSAVRTFPYCGCFGLLTFAHYWRIRRFLFAAGRTSPVWCAVRRHAAGKDLLRMPFPCRRSANAVCSAFSTLPAFPLHISGRQRRSPSASLPGRFLVQRHRVQSGLRKRHFRAMVPYLLLQRFGAYKRRRTGALNGTARRTLPPALGTSAVCSMPLRQASDLFRSYAHGSRFSCGTWLPAYDHCLTGVRFTGMYARAGETRGRCAYARGTSHATPRARLPALRRVRLLPGGRVLVCTVPGSFPDLPPQRRSQCHIRPLPATTVLKVRHRLHTSP